VRSESRLASGRWSSRCPIPAPSPRGSLPSIQATSGTGTPSPNVSCPRSAGRSGRQSCARSSSSPRRAVTRRSRRPRRLRRLAAAKPLDLELMDGAELPAVSTRFGKVRLLVRLRGQPIASVDLANDPRDLELAELRRKFASWFASELWAELTLQVPDARHEETSTQPVTVIVCTGNRPENLEECLGALAAQRHPSFGVVVVDNAPVDDRPRVVAERFGVRYVVEPRPGLDCARNRGLTEVDTALVAYTDDDARPDPGWLAALCAGFAAEEVGAVTGLVAPAELGTRAQALFEDV